MDICENHYARKRRGVKDWHKKSMVEMTPEERFWDKVDKNGGYPDFNDQLVRLTNVNGQCWLWTAMSQFGYGVIVWDGKNKKAHRISLEIKGITIPDGMTIDHLCRRTLCVNPDHLEIVTHAENNLRGNSVSGKNSRKTHCSRGHEFKDGSYYITKQGARKCKECNLIVGRERRNRLKNEE